MPTAIGRSNEDPSFLMSAGARFMVILRRGNSKPQLRMAAAIRSRLSLMALSGSPTMENPGRLFSRWVSTSTRNAFTPYVALLRTFESKGLRADVWVRAGRLGYYQQYS